VEKEKGPPPPHGKPTFTLLGYYIEKGKGSKIFLIELETKTIRARIK